jgi:dTDP-4-amino-4,6-dideoxygalactose transaminase
MSEIVRKFERSIADFYGAPYAVATDSCTHAIELSLRYQKVTSVTCPSQTYLSIPFTFMKLGLEWRFVDQSWIDFYSIGKTNIVDAAVYWKKNGYIPGTYMCLSFQFRKHLNLIRGGAILLDDPIATEKLRRMTTDGRDVERLWKEQDIDTIGYHYYMPIETAELGLMKLPEAIAREARRWTSDEYPRLPELTVFKNPSKPL